MQSSTVVEHITDYRKGIYWMVLATVLFVCLDTTGKYLTQHYPVPQVVWARFAFHLLFVILILGRRIHRVVASHRLGLQILRSLFMLGANAFFFLGVRTLPLVDASSILFVAPLVVTALSVPLLGEGVGPRRWAAVLVGFAGAMIIIRPGPGILQSAAVLPLMAAFSFSFYQITTRVLSHSDGTMTTLLYTAVAGAVLTSAILPWNWHSPDSLGWVLMGLAGVFGALGQLALIKAIAVAPLGVIAPFNYLTLAWATVLGFVVFADLPDVQTIVGAAIIVSSGLYVLHREQVRAGGGAMERIETAASAAGAPSYGRDSDGEDAAGR